MTNRLRNLFAVCALTAGLVVAALEPNQAGASEQHTVTLEDGMLSTTQIDAKVGDTVKFVHLDDVGLHALYSDSEGHSFDLSTMKHGDHYDLNLTAPGTVEVNCYKMPDMKLLVTVTE